MGGSNHSITHLEWPSIPRSALPPVSILLNQLAASEWLPADVLERHQLTQFTLLANWAWQHSPYFRQRLPAPGLAPWTMDRFREIPLLASDTYSENAESIDTESPLDHGGHTVFETSGSVGRPTRLRKTKLNGVFWEALTLREHLWQRRDFRGSLAISRAKVSDGNAPPIHTPDWGLPVSRTYASGPCQVVDVRKAVNLQAEWLCQFNPTYLLTYPTNLAGILECLADGNSRPLSHLRQVRTVAEAVSETLRERCLEVLGVGIADTYSSQEFGPIAFQCHEHQTYHVQAESLLVEVLGEDGHPCEPGEIGQIVVTDLHNFATPLIRYVIGDFAEVAPPCPCGRGLAAWKRIIGRTRNMAVHPEGFRFWPNLWPYSFRALAGVRQIQVIQTGLDLMHVIYVAPVPVTPEQRTAMEDKLIASIGYTYRFEFEHRTEFLDRSVGGKFEDFICRVPPEQIPKSGHSR